MMQVSEQLLLNWSNFQDQATSTFRELRQCPDFSDVTLACEDGGEVMCHKVVLASSSLFFKRFFERQKPPHPLIYMRGLTKDCLEALLDFIYLGEATIEKENLEDFLSLANELKIKGLELGERHIGIGDNSSLDSPKQQYQDFGERHIGIGDDSSQDSPKEQYHKKTETHINNERSSSSLSQQPYTAVAVKENGSAENRVDSKKTVSEKLACFENAATPQRNNLAELNIRIKSLMIMSENRFGRKNERGRICMVCGKEGKISLVIKHFYCSIFIHFFNILQYFLGDGAH